MEALYPVLYIHWVGLWLIRDPYTHFHLLTPIKTSRLHFNSNNTSASPRVNLLFFHVFTIFYHKGHYVTPTQTSCTFVEGNPSNLPYIFPLKSITFVCFTLSFLCFPLKLRCFTVFWATFFHRFFVGYHPCVDRLNPSPWNSQVGCQVGGPELKILKHRSNIKIMEVDGRSLFLSESTPRKTNECALKRTYFNKKYIWTNHPFSGDMLVFRGVNGWFVGYKCFQDVLSGCLMKNPIKTVAFLPSQFPCHLEEPRTCFSG